MANEELSQRNYLTNEGLKGDAFGEFERFNLGATSLAELISAGLDASVATSVPFPFALYSPPNSPSSAKPDMVIADRRKGTVVPVCCVEWKKKTQFDSTKKQLKASEQALLSSAALGARFAVSTDGTRFLYIDVDESLNQAKLVSMQEHRDLTPGIVDELIASVKGEAKNPTQLAQTVWQSIWAATKEEPKQCLLTFVELFMLKFLSDNLPSKHLPRAKSFYELVDKTSEEFVATHGCTAIEYYVNTIRPHIKSIFPDNTLATDESLPTLFGLSTIVSKTSIINGFAFLKSGSSTVSSFNRTFLEILDKFNRYGALTNIDKEFKLRLYETFLKNTPRAQSLGQFFTPRNVVREMIRMAQLGKLPPDSVVLDPAAGVGGFILEPLLLDNALQHNLRIEAGKPKRRVKVVGIDVDANTHILAKANMLIHTSDLLKEETATIEGINKALADTFVLMNSHETLGTLENPPAETVDVVLANPPYVTQGSAIYRKEIAEINGLRNGLDLKEYYEGWGLGLESLFLRYISGSLKPGGMAFVIVPLGLLNRTEPKPKRKLLEECNIRASISLPRNTFFNTAQLTSILVLEKRHTGVDPRPAVLCGYARSTGETLDMYRIPTPDENDLSAVADAFIRLTALDDGDTLAVSDPFIKIASADKFSENDRWDVARFWSETELVDLGIKAAAISRDEFISEATNTMADLVIELKESRAELSELVETETREVVLSDRTMFKVRSGNRIKNLEVKENPGGIPVYSCFRYKHLTKGSISEAFLKARKIPIEEADRTIITVAANGASVGRVFTRRERCALTDDLIAIEIESKLIDPDYLAAELRRAIAAGGFIYEAKLFKGRVEKLSASIPVRVDGSFDLPKQKEISAAIDRFETIRDKLRELGDWSAEARLGR